MTKRLVKQINSFKYSGEPIRVTFGTLILTCLCILLLIIATFTQLNIKHPCIPLDFLFGRSDEYLSAKDFIKVYKYVPQIPTLFFIIAFLGRKFGTLAILGYIFLGMFFPIFALGGGITYVFEYSFGYILAFIPTIFFSGTLLKIRKDFLRIVLLSTLGVLAIHIIGVLYMLFIASLRHAPIDIISSLISSQSGIKIVYDIILSIFTIYIGRFARKIFWIIMC